MIMAWTSIFSMPTIYYTQVQHTVAKSQTKESSVYELFVSLRESIPRALVLVTFALIFLWARLKLNQGPPLFHV